MALPLIPLFPLSLVLLPAMPLPLHIFEERYKEMIGEIIAENEASHGTGSEFGVVLAKDEGIINIGCTASVQKVMRRYDDGRLDLLALGQRRFRIQGINEERSYLRAEVEFFEDVDLNDVPQELASEAVTCLRTLLHFEGRDPGMISATRVSFQIAHLIDDLDKRQTVLSLRSEVERLQFLTRVVPDYIQTQQRMKQAKRVGPLNGHLKTADGANGTH